MKEVGKVRYWYPCSSGRDLGWALFNCGNVGFAPWHLCVNYNPVKEQVRPWLAWSGPGLPHHWRGKRRSCGPTHVSSVQRDEVIEKLQQQWAKGLERRGERGLQGKHKCLCKIYEPFAEDTRVKHDWSEILKKFTWFFKPLVTFVLTLEGKTLLFCTDNLNMWTLEWLQLASIFPILQYLSASTW